MVAVIKRIIDINNGEGKPDDIDHLGNRRIKTVGELIQNQLRIGLAAHGACGARTYVDPRPRTGDTVEPDQHSPSGGCHARILWRQPVEPIYGSDQSVWPN